MTVLTQDGECRGRRWRRVGPHGPCRYPKLLNFGYIPRGRGCGTRFWGRTPLLSPYRTCPRCDPPPCANYATHTNIRTTAKCIVAGTQNVERLYHLHTTFGKRMRIHQP